MPFYRRILRKEHERNKEFVLKENRPKGHFTRVDQKAKSISKTTFISTYEGDIQMSFFVIDCCGAMNFRYCSTSFFIPCGKIFGGS